jgi:hypothetical protein
MHPVSKFLKLLSIVIVFLSIATIAMAQPSSPTSPSSATLFEEIDDVPINGAIALLTSAGIGLGIRKLYSRKK